MRVVGYVVTGMVGVGLGLAGGAALFIGGILCGAAVVLKADEKEKSNKENTEEAMVDISVDENEVEVQA